MPKELLPFIDKPIIQYAVEEAIAAGITELVFVTGRTKRAIEDHFDTNPELERELHEKGKHDVAAAIHGIIPDHVNCIFIRQPQALGLGHAVLCAAPVIGRDPFAVLLADDVVKGTPSPTAELIAAYARTGCTQLSVMDVARPKFRNTASSARASPQAPSRVSSRNRSWRRLASIGRYDCGSKFGYLEAIVDFALDHAEYGPAFGELIAQRARRFLKTENQRMCGWPRRNPQSAAVCTLRNLQRMRVLG